MKFITLIYIEELRKKRRIKETSEIARSISYYHRVEYQQFS